MNESDSIASIINMAYETVSKSVAGPVFYYFRSDSEIVPVTLREMKSKDASFVLKNNENIRVMFNSQSFELLKMIVLSRLGYKMKFNENSPGDDWKKGLGGD